MNFPAHALTSLWMTCVMLIYCLTLIPGCIGDTHDPTRQAERDRMVSEQIIPRGIKDQAILAAMRRIPRHRFVPAFYSALAYNDGPLPIGHGQTISQPFVVALMSDALALQGAKKVLEIGTGSGYQAAVLAEIVPHVFTIEIVEPLATEAARTLAELGYRNIHTRVGDGYQGWPEEAPLRRDHRDRLVRTCATTAPRSTRRWRAPDSPGRQSLPGTSGIGPLSQDHRRL
jgi:protein-L-isoaspartate(D-aspartate) O-methyltransferase